MRTAFVRTLAQLAQNDERIYLLTGDLGFAVLEQFRDAFPDRFINVGVAEQNMIGIATGLAEAGLIPFCYSIATFASMRPYEFIRNGPVVHELPVRIIGVGGGFEYGHNGIAHFALEDIAIMRTQPALRVVAPADAGQMKTVLEKTWNLDGPTYYRIGKDDRLVVPGLDARFDWDEVQVPRAGKGILILSTGAIGSEAARAAAMLADEGIACAHAVIAQLNPAPTEALKALLQQYSDVITVEAHYATGGLFSLTAEVVALENLPCRLHRCAIERMPSAELGESQYLYDLFGISAEKIAAKAKAIVSLKEAVCKT